MKRLLICIVVVASAFVLCGVLHGQPRRLSVGETAPDLVLGKLLFNQNKPLKLSDLRGKAVLLDFWSTTCGSCIAAFPVIQALQKKYGDRLQIVLVNAEDNPYDSPDRCRSAIRQYENRTGTRLQLPVVVGGYEMKKYFPYVAIPHEVWIENDRRVTAITSAEFVTDSAIERLVQGKELSLPVKTDVYAFDKTLPLLEQGNGGPENAYLSRSVLTRYNPSVPMGMGTRRNAAGKQTGYYVFNSHIRSLLRVAYQKIFAAVGSEQREIYEGKWQAMLRSGISDTTARFCFDLSVTATDQRFDAAQYLRDELFRNFRLVVLQETRTINGYAMVISAPVSDSGKYEMDIDPSSKKIFMHHQTLTQLIQLLESWLGKPVKAQAAQQGYYDLDFPAGFDLTNKSSLISWLSQNGFVLTPADITVPVVVVKDEMER